MYGGRVTSFAGWLRTGTLSIVVFVGNFKVFLLRRGLGPRFASSEVFG